MVRLTNLDGEAQRQPGTQQMWLLAIHYAHYMQDRVMIGPHVGHITMETRGVCPEKDAADSKVERLVVESPVPSQPAQVCAPLLLTHQAAAEARQSRSRGTEPDLAKLRCEDRARSVADDHGASTDLSAASSQPDDHVGDSWTSQLDAFVLSGLPSISLQCRASLLSACMSPALALHRVCTFTSKLACCHTALKAGSHFAADL